MRICSQTTIGWFALCIFLIFLVDFFTVKPHVISGSGNLGLVFVLPALVVFFLFARSLWRGLGKRKLKLNTSKGIIFGTLSLLLLFCYLEYTFAFDLVTKLGGTPGTVSSRIYRYPWINQYTNTMFVNFYTLGILITGTLLFYFIRSKIRIDSHIDGE
jgi:hypothetical protein